MTTTPKLDDQITQKTVKSVIYAVLRPLIILFRWLQHKFEAPFRFFLKHFFKTPFMVSMSKKVQMHGIEKVFNMGPKAFFYFFMFYLIRDTVIYIVIPIYLARATGE